MHQELMNQDVARLQRAEILRNSGKRHVVEASPQHEEGIGHDVGELGLALRRLPALSALPPVSLPRLRRD